MALAQLEKVIPFSDVPFDEDADWNILFCSGCDWHVDDIFGEVPETVRFHAGSIQLPTELVIDHPAECGYYVVDGSLTVDGLLRIQIDDELNAIIVMGDLRATGLAVSWETQLYVMGRTTFNGPLLANLSEDGACYLNGGATAEAVFDVGDVPPFLAQDTRNVPRPDVAARYKVDEGDDPIVQMLDDLRAGKSVTK